MPEMDGFEVAKFLKSSKKTSHIPIVFLTAEFKSEEFINKGYKLGALDYFIKPIEEFQFLNKMSLYINLFLAQKIQQKEFDDTLSEYRKLMYNHIISSDTDIDGKIIHVSQAFCDITGYSKQELCTNWALRGLHGAADPLTVTTMGSGASTVSMPPGILRLAVIRFFSILTISSVYVICVSPSFSAT